MNPLDALLWFFVFGVGLGLAAIGLSLMLVFALVAIDWAERRFR